MDPTPDAARRPDKSPRPLMRLLAVAGIGVLILAAVIGFALARTPSWKRTGPPITVSGWAPYWQTDSAYASFSANSAVFSDVSLFAYHATGAETVGPFDQLDPNAVGLFQQAAHRAGVKFTASIIDGTDAHVMAAILADPATRSVHVHAIVQLALTSGFDGIDLDYEKFAFSDGRDTWDATRPNWVAFVTELAAALHKESKTLTVSVPDPGYSVYDYKAMGKVVDHIRIMAYDYSTSEAGPIAPIDWVAGVVEAAKKLVPADKLVLGVPVYGYDWPVQVDGTCPVGPKPKKRNLSTKSAAALAASKGIAPIWDQQRAERTFSYSEQLVGNDSSGNPVTCIVKRSVWYADAQAVHIRAWLAERQDLSGISLWSLGSEDTVTWEGIAAARADLSTWPPVTEPATVAATTATAASFATTSAS